MRPVIGYRAWHWDGYSEQLKALTLRNYSWHHGINYAECYRSLNTGLEPCLSIPGPSSACACGFNAWYSLRLLLKEVKTKQVKSDLVLGAIAGAGDFQLHSKGFRSEQAQILAFYVTECYRTAPAIQAAEKLGVPVFLNAEELEEYVSRYGERRTADISRHF